MEDDEADGGVGADKGAFCASSQSVPKQPTVKEPELPDKDLRIIFINMNQLACHYPHSAPSVKKKPCGEKGFPAAKLSGGTGWLAKKDALSASLYPRKNSAASSIRPPGRCRDKQAQISPRRLPHPRHPPRREAPCRVSSAGFPASTAAEPTLVGFAAIMLTSVTPGQGCKARTRRSKAAADMEKSTCESAFTNLRA